MQGLNVIVFTAGVGENEPNTRTGVCNYLKCFGIEIDAEINNCKGKEIKISTENSKVSVYAVPTNEELMIARETMELIK